SRDQGHTWDTPSYLTYANGRKVKHPRAANFAWRCENGKFLYWFHNHGGEYIGQHSNPSSIGYNDRNPVWIMGGIEKDGSHGKVIEWTQPEVLLYTDDPIVRMSYPDLIEENGEYYFTETQKDIARVHHVDKNLLHNLWDQLSDPKSAGDDGLVLEWTRKEESSGIESMDNPKIPAFYMRDSKQLDGSGKSTRAGFTIDLRLELSDLQPGEKLLNTIDQWGQGWSLKVNDDKNLELELSDGR